MEEPIGDRLERLESLVRQYRIDSETREAALQYMVAQLLRQIYVIVGLSDDQIKDTHEKVLNLFKRYRHGGSDPAMSDHISAEIEKWIAEILNDTDELRRLYQSRGAPG